MLSFWRGKNEETPQKPNGIEVGEENDSSENTQKRVGLEMVRMVYIYT